MEERSAGPTDLAPSPTLTPPGGPDGEARILVVDDEPDLLNAVRLYLEMEGYQVITATNGEEALRRSARACPT